MNNKIYQYLLYFKNIQEYNSIREAFKDTLNQQLSVWICFIYYKL